MTAAILLVVGPNIPQGLLRRHCVAVLSSRRALALVQLSPIGPRERSLLRALTRRYGQSRVRLVQTHRDWLLLPATVSVVVLSDSGMWCDDDRITDAGRMLEMTPRQVVAMYATGGGSR